MPRRRGCTEAARRGFPRAHFHSAFPTSVRLNRQLGHDYIANLTFDGWWLFETAPCRDGRLAQATDGTMYDVGANTGFYSRPGGQAVTYNRCQGLRTHPGDRRLRPGRTWRSRGLDVDRVTRWVALSDRPGTAELLPPEIPGRIESSASLLSDFKPTVVESVTAATRTLDGANERLAVNVSG